MSKSKRTLAVLLAGSLAASGGLVALPATTHAATQQAAAATTLAVTPSTTNRGGLVTVTASGFKPNEKITFSIKGQSGTIATAQANAQGMLPATGITIPYTLKPGSYTLTATGAQSKKTVTGQLMLQKLQPTITVSAPTVSPGALETVHGNGFGRQEQITLSLNGQAVVTSPQAITTTNGSFSATFTVPSRLLRGNNTISAIGNESQVTSATTITGKLARATQFYMSGGNNAYNVHSDIALLNTNAEPASVKMIFYFDNGTEQTRTVTVNANSKKLVPVIGLNLPAGHFGVQINADREITAQLNLNRVAQLNGQDSATILGTPGQATRWYLATGSTTGNSKESVSILNTDPATPAHVQMQFVTKSGMAKTVTVTVPAHTDYVANVNKMLPNQDAGIIATSDRPVVVERTMTFGPNNSGLTALDGSNKPATSWLFAAGTTQNGVQTSYTVVNPSSTSATVTASFFGQDNTPVGNKTITVAPDSRATIKLGDVVGLSQKGDIAAVVTANQAIVVERTEYTGAMMNARSGSDVFGRNGGSTLWSFPGGNTNVGMHEVLVLFNPTQTSLPVTATFYDASGHMVTRKITLAPNAHDSINVNALGLGTSHGAVLKSMSSLGFIAEQGITMSNGSLLSSTQGLAQ